MTINEMLTLTISSFALALSVVIFIRSLKQERENAQISRQQEKIVLEQDRQDVLLSITRIEGLDSNLKRKIWKYATMAKGTPDEEDSVRLKKTYKSILEDSEHLKRNLINASGDISEELKLTIKKTQGALLQLEHMVNDRVMEINELIQNLDKTNGK